MTNKLLARCITLCITLCITQLISVSFIAAQSGKLYSLQGIITDSVSHKAVEFATVGIFDTSKTPLQITFTSARGEFKFKDLKAGTYRVEATAIGYGGVLKSGIVVDKNTVLPMLSIAASGENLNAVTVTSVRPVMEMKDGKIVYNVANDPTNAGATNSVK